MSLFCDAENRKEAEVKQKKKPMRNEYKDGREKQAIMAKLPGGIERLYFFFNWDCKSLIFCLGELFLGSFSSHFKEVSNAFSLLPIFS